jgi:hypothetical protein
MAGAEEEITRIGILHTREIRGYIRERVYC